MSKKLSLATIGLAITLTITVAISGVPGCATPSRNITDETYHDTTPPTMEDRALDSYNLGMIAYDSGNYEIALDYFTQAIDLWEGDVEGQVDCLIMRAKVSSALKRFDRAKMDIDSAISLMPAKTESYYERAVIYYKQGNHLEAEKTLDIVINLDPDSFKAYNFKGNIYRMRGELELAVIEYNKSISIDDTYAPSYFNRGLVKNEMGDYRAAIEDFTEAISRYQDNRVEYKAQAYWMRGEAFLMVGDTKMANRDKSKAETLYPGISGEDEDTGPRWGKGEVGP